jgi:hypothetical protein
MRWPVDGRRAAREHRHTSALLDAIRRRRATFIWLSSGLLLAAGTLLLRTPASSTKTAYVLAAVVFAAATGPLGMAYSWFLDAGYPDLGRIPVGLGLGVLAVVAAFGDRTFLAGLSFVLAAATIGLWVLERWWLGGPLTYLRAVRATPGEFPTTESALYSISVAAGVAPCQLYIVDTPYLNAYAVKTARHPNIAVVTRGIASSFDLSQQEAVCAYLVAALIHAPTKRGLDELDALSLDLLRDPGAQLAALSRARPGDVDDSGIIMTGGAIADRLSGSVTPWIPDSSYEAISKRVQGIAALVGLAGSSA